MADFKLGRIRFIWKGSWTASTTYYKDDIIRNGGNTYVCITGHTASLSFPDDQTNWNKISDGQEWKADWTLDTYYKVNDIVKYGGYLYICNTAHTSANNVSDGLELDLATDSTDAKWDLYAEGFDYKADWAPSTRYKINDIVKYNSTIYLCTEGHTSATDVLIGLENDQSKWDVFSQGVSWQADWQVSNRYVVNDIIRYGGRTYVCNTGHVSAATAALGLEADQAKWDIFHDGIEFKGDWTTGTRYKLNDLVKSGAGIWICTTYHTSQNVLSDDEAKWSQFIEGLEFEDSWAGTTYYQAGDFVTYGGYSYVAITNNVGQRPTDNPTDWDLFTTGFRLVGDWGADSSNFQYFVGDVVRQGGYTYLCILDNTGQEPPNLTYWERLNQGIEWNDAWTDATEYDLGDAVRYGSSSYIAVAKHTSDEIGAQNRPDQDVSGVTWNLLSGGGETLPMTTEGDMVYYGGAGPTRLAIGEPGQALKVNSAGNAPEWGFFGKINHVWYVSTSSGVDSPAPNYGTTLDQPWKTINYSLRNIEEGALNPNAKYILAANRAFIQAETVEWVDYQITNDIAPFTSAYTYDKEKCRRDTGQIIDALVWDVSHGGNQKSRTAALTYFDSNGDLIAAIADEDGETAAALAYSLSLIDSAILQSIDPSANYQTLNAVGSPITQVKDLTKPEETGVQTIINTLMGITIDSITAASSDGIPAEVIPNNTLFVKTGTYAEVLPMIVPEQTAVVGDELRSTRITPAGSLVDSGDTTYTLAAIARLKAITSDIVTNGAVTKTTGNAQSQVTTRPAGGADPAVHATDLWQQIYDYINWGVNGAAGDSTEPVKGGTNTPQTSTDYTYAVEAIEANRLFLVEEAIAYIADTYPAYVYDEDKCRRDVNRYIDAIKYDIIYQPDSVASPVQTKGNYKSLTAAEQYVNAVNGSLTENMFYMRNGTGLRNCTTADLTGTLSAANAYGTQRPTAGAYVSLDPGWGPDDSRAWITNKSPYVQNVTTFGTGCIGMKVDGDLHNGGNDSIVANDFTQILSDGIGAWVTNLGRSELVSVFSYYNHIGYLAENGGKIRATNGNNSYGDFGSVSEGVDATETPVTAKVDNRKLDAVVDSVMTDGDDVLVLNYLNAGQNYTVGGTTIAITGEGYGLGTVTPTVNNGAVFNVRLLDTDIDGDSTADTGGAEYLNSTNSAQEGDTTSITISNTDTALSSQYIGMAIYITAGTGAGQYGYINSYNAGTKIAQVYKMSDGTAGWDHVIGNSIVAALDATTEYSIEPRLTFTAPPSGLYADTAKARAVIADEKIARVIIWDPGSGYTSVPTMTITDPNNTIEAPFVVRVGDGVLAQPTYTDRGTAFTTATAEVVGDGFADQYQPGEFVEVNNLSEEPQPGSNIVFDHLPNNVFKLVAVRDFQGAGPYSAQLQVSPELTISQAPEHQQDLEMRIRYSQVRLTGHDFLDIGTGNFGETNYPNAPAYDPNPLKETTEKGGGRVFFTSTDQDGNFRVGDLFSVEQSTGIATLNADAFNISGLQELSLGELGLGSTGAVINEFSTDGTFTANSDNVVPTQKAIKTYITSQIGGGAATLNVNSVTAGQIEISGQQITTTLGTKIDVLNVMNFEKGVNGVPVAMNYFLT
jgi:hypothetical protein